eukprot:TRINITY_DN12563_c0_g1_i1.p1 TRINITY_DN12563_c0_g1~~TRINITY_DN12563_c0_g1_i1.p1  ORF type:complete len:531 (+),score=185.46 TRINITY_DN12563_c0_g1_i1:59-1594(+)
MQGEDQWLAAFSAFDLDGSGAISQTDVRYAFQACDSIGTLVPEKDVQMAMRRLRMGPGEMVSFPVFCRLCELVDEFQRPRKQLAQIASQLPIEEEQEERSACQTSPRRCTRSVPRADWYNKAEDFSYLRGPMEENPPDALPTSPLSPRACLGEVPSIDAVAHAFYLFDTDFSGAVSGCELPRMLRLVPRGGWSAGQWVRSSDKDKKVQKTLARPGESGEGGANSKATKKAQKKWDDALLSALNVVGKEYADLLNVHDFQVIVDVLDPPPDPRAPDEQHDDGYETTESEKQRRAEEEERLRREQEAHEMWEKMMGGTLIVKVEDGSYLKLLLCDSGDSVKSLYDKIQEQTRRSPADMRLIGRGFELDSRKKICDYGIKVGTPWHLVPPGGPFVWDDGDILTLLWRERPNLDDEDNVVSGWLQVQLWEGTRITVWCEDDEPIEHIQRRIGDEVHVPPTQQRLVVHGREMNGRKTLRDYKVALGPAGDVIDLILREAPAEPMRLRSFGSPRHIM